MKLIKANFITVNTYTKGLIPTTGKQGYTLTSSVQTLASVLPFKVSRVPDFQVDLVRTKDHWIVISKVQINSDQSNIVQWKGQWFSVVSSEDTAFVGAGVGYYKSVIKLGVDQAYGV